MLRTAGPWLAFMVLVTPAGAQPAIRDITPTYGPLGPTRKSWAVPAGDEVYFRYTITGVRTDHAGRVDGELEVQLAGPSGQTLLDEKQPIKNVLALGGHTLPGTASASFGADAPVGDYTMTVTFRDKLSSQSTSFKRTVACEKPTFALVHVRLSHDKNGTIPAAGGMLGQAIHVRCQAIGFDRSKARVHVVISMQTADAGGRSLMPEPVQVQVRNDDASQASELRSVDFNGSLILNRIGEFYLILTAADEVSGQKAEVKVPLRVTNAP